MFHADENLFPSADMTERELGNQQFARGNFAQAIQNYTKAIEHDDDKLSALTNRSLCFLRTDQTKLALDDANRALQIEPHNQKALYRKACALENLGNNSEAYLVAKDLLGRDGSNSSFRSLFSRLDARIRKQLDEHSSTQIQIEKAVKEIGEADDPTKICSGFRKLLHFVEAGGGGARKLAEVYMVELSRFLDLNESQALAFRFYSEVCVDSVPARGRLVFDKIIEPKKLVELIAISDDREVCRWAAQLLDSATLSFSDLLNLRKTKKPINKAFGFDKQTQKLIDELFRLTGNWLDEPSCSSFGRDHFLRFVLKYADREQSLAWSARFIPFGIPKVLRISASIADYPRYLPLGEDTQMLATCVLGSIYDDLCSDPERDQFRTTCESFLRDLLNNCTPDQVRPFKTKAIQSLACILQGVFDVGNSILGNQGLVGIIMELATSGCAVEQKIALDAILLASSKADKAVGILSNGITVLKALFMSSDPDVQVRALVGLCGLTGFVFWAGKKNESCPQKIVSWKGSDHSKKTLSETGFSRLTKACTGYLCQQDSRDRKFYAVDGLAYLSLDGDVKQELVSNELALKELFAVCRSSDELVVDRVSFGATSILANLTNAEPVKKPDDEMIKLAKYAKHHIPEQHPKDSDEFVSRRRTRLVGLGVCEVLNVLAKQKSEACALTVAKIFCAISEEVSDRGTIVASGAAKTLIPLSATNRSSSNFACRAIAKLAISANPQLAFQGERCLEVVDSVSRLLNPECSGLDNFEALLALTNLATVSDSVRRKIVNDHFMSVEHLMFEEHEMIRRAATELVCNLAGECRNRFEGDNDRVKMLVAFCGLDEDVLLQRAAAGALCQLTFDSEEICRKVVEVSSFFEIAKEIMTAEDIELQFRAFYLVRNLLESSEESAKQIVGSELMDVAVAVTRLDDGDRLRVKGLADEIVKYCLEKELIKPGVGAFN